MSEELEETTSARFLPRDRWNRHLKSSEEIASIRLAEKIRASHLDLSELRAVAASNDVGEDWMLGQWPSLNLLIAETRREFREPVNPDVWWAVWNAYYGHSIEVMQGTWIRVEARA